MSKKFWIKCIKRFFIVTLPILGTFVSIFACFSFKFEKTIKTLGFLGAIIVCLLCFCITLLYGINEMIEVVDIVDKNISNNRIIYNYYIRYNIENNICKKFCNKLEKAFTLDKDSQKGLFCDKFIKMTDIYNDALQEICYEVMATGVTSICNLVNLSQNEYESQKYYSLIKTLPTSLYNVNIKAFKQNIESNYVSNVLVNYSGNIHGSILICLYEKFRAIICEQIQNDFADYIKKEDYNSFVNSFIHELGNIFAGSCLTSLSMWSMNPSEIKEIKLDIEIDNYKFDINTENVYVTKLLCTNNEHKLFDSYMILDKIQAHNLLKKCFQNKKILL